jgi:CDP-diacylglycerol--serine O-phosphatidyltransferase
MRWIRKISIADYVSLTNGLFGFLAITYIIDGNFTAAYLFLFLCILIDGIDGRLARYFKSKHRFGQYIDSFSDAISFCFAPAILMYSSFYDPTKGSALVSVENTVAVLVPVTFLSFGILRLARFAAGGYRERNFVGMPSPAAAFLVVNLCILFGNGGLIGTNGVLVFAVAFGAALLMISEIPYPKIEGGLFAPTAVAVGLSIVSATLLLLSTFIPFVIAVAMIALVFIFVYVVGGPVYVRFSQREYLDTDEA